MTAFLFLKQQAGFQYGQRGFTLCPRPAQKIDIRTVDIDTLRDIRDVKINTDLPKEERILDFIRQIGNPYCYRHGKYVIKISFTDTDVTLEQRMLSYLRSKC